MRVPGIARRSNQSILKEIDPEYSLEGLMLKLKFPILWPPDAKTESEKTLILGKIGGKKGTTEDKMVGWHYRLSGHEFEQTLGDGEGQENLACCSPWCCKELDMTERLNKVPCNRKKKKAVSAFSWWRHLVGTAGITDITDSPYLVRLIVSLS